MTIMNHIRDNLSSWVEKMVDAEGVDYDSLNVLQQTCDPSIIASISLFSASGNYTLVLNPNQLERLDSYEQAEAIVKHELAHMIIERKMTKSRLKYMRDMYTGTQAKIDRNALWDFEIQADLLAAKHSSHEDSYGALMQVAKIYAQDLSADIDCLIDCETVTHPSFRRRMDALLMHVVEN